MENRYGVMRGFLDPMKDNRTRVVIIMKNGYQMGGRIIDWDESAMRVDVDGIDQLVMLSAMSTVIPKE